MEERKKILPRMSDVRPVNRAVFLDLERNEKMKRTAALVKQAQSRGEWLEKIKKEEISNKKQNDWQKNESPKSVRAENHRGYQKPVGKNKIRHWWLYLKTGAAFILVIFVFNLVFRGFEIKKNGLTDSQAAMEDILAAKDSIKKGDFEKAYVQFNNAHEKLDRVSTQLDGMGRILVEATKFLPYLSKISSGSHVISAGNDISQVGILGSDILKKMDGLKAGGEQGSSISYLEFFRDNEKDIRRMATLLEDAQKELDSVNVADIPPSERSQFMDMKQLLPEVNSAMAAFLGQEKIFNDILGGNGPRKYLFLFQNNQEARATGGFIGSYGLLDIFEGRVRKFFIDGIFNPDGQLRTRIIPPVPVQKISANWSLHDSNWFPNFPTSAEKAAWFYEKAGGPTVDGVITMTPTVMQKLLEVTGPIDMPEYDMVVDKDNFIQEVQYQVEVDYDKELNNPKKILGDLAPKILDKILNMKSFPEMSKALNVMVESLNEKQILIYSKNSDIEAILSDNGWSGEILDTPKDYLSVINTNINGFKTDGVVDEVITHKAEIQEDGSIIDTLTIVRHHNGGDTPYEWWNKVNADYLRVYVPRGARLISAEGQTREVNYPPLDYAALGYVPDAQVQAEEDSIFVDAESGTRVYDDGTKTVFANWVYVSPKETVTLKYTYLLPFKIEMDSVRLSDTYSLLAQKQSGSRGSAFSTSIYYPIAYHLLWQNPQSGVSSVDDGVDGQTGLKMVTDLKTDKFFGVAFTR